MFNGELSTIEVLDIEMADTWTQCTKIATPIHDDITSTNLLVLSEAESILILGGTNEEQNEPAEDGNSSDEANEEEADEEDNTNQDGKLDEDPKVLCLTSSDSSRVRQI